MFASLAGFVWPQSVPNSCPNAQPVPPELRLPPRLPPGEPVEFEKQIRDYLATYRYRQLGWCVDKSVRDTGPYVNGAYYGTHPAVRIYYSPEVMEWLRGGRKGKIRDGAVILKEQYSPPPAIQYQGLTGDQLKPADWTFMIRASSQSKDGWFWGEVWTTPPGMTFDKIEYPNAGFGLTCLRCHSSAGKEYTYEVPVPAGTDASKVRVRATLYYQSIPPAYLQQAFASADGPATQRLRYLTGRLNLRGTALENWKIRIASGSND